MQEFLITINQREFELIIKNTSNDILTELLNTPDNKLLIASRDGIDFTSKYRLNYYDQVSGYSPLNVIGLPDERILFNHNTPGIITDNYIVYLSFLRNNVSNSNILNIIDRRNNTFTTKTFERYFHRVGLSYDKDDVIAISGVSNLSSGGLISTDRVVLDTSTLIPETNYYTRSIQHAVARLGNKIYVAGGWTELEPGYSRRLTYYNLTTKTWVRLTDFPTEFRLATMVSYKHFLFLINPGFKDNQNIYFGLKYFVFNTLTNKWYNIPNNYFPENSALRLGSDNKFIYFIYSDGLWRWDAEKFLNSLS